MIHSAAHLAYDIFSKYKYLMVNLVFPTSAFGMGYFFWLRLFLIIAPLVPFLYFDIEALHAGMIMFYVEKHCKTFAVLSGNYINAKMVT